jgi:hypothetical protein
MSGRPDSLTRDDLPAIARRYGDAEPATLMRL